LTSPAGWAVDDPALEPGGTLERQIRGGGTHSFRIQAGAGQLLHLVVDQKRIDVTVALLFPDGRQLAQSDLPNGDCGPEPIALGPAASGDYKIAVSVPSSKAAAGSYTIRAAALREPSAADLRMAEAEAAMQKAEALRRKHTEPARREAIEQYEL